MSEPMTVVEEKLTEAVTVTFIGDYFTLTHTLDFVAEVDECGEVSEEDEERAIEKATANLKQIYGSSFDMEKLAKVDASAEVSW